MVQHEFNPRGAGKEIISYSSCLEALERAITDVPMGLASFEDEPYTPVELPLNIFSISQNKKTKEKSLLSMRGITSKRCIRASRLADTSLLGLFKEDQRLNQQISHLRLISSLSATQLFQRTIFRIRLNLCRLKKNGENSYLMWQIEVQSFDQTSCLRKQRVAINRVSEVTRSFPEWCFAKSIIEKELDKGDIIVRDGTLHTFVTNESKYANETHAAAIKKGVYSRQSKNFNTLHSTG